MSRQFSLDIQAMNMGGVSMKRNWVGGNEENWLYTIIMTQMDNRHQY